jgi:hypothetical protein
VAGVSALIQRLRVSLLSYLRNGPSSALHTKVRKLCARHGGAMRNNSPTSNGGSTEQLLSNSLYFSECNFLKIYKIKIFTYFIMSFTYCKIEYESFQTIKDYISKYFNSPFHFIKFRLWLLSAVEFILLHVKFRVFATFP